MDTGPRCAGEDRAEEGVRPPRPRGEDSGEGRRAEGSRGEARHPDVNPAGQSLRSRSGCPRDGLPSQVPPEDPPRAPGTVCSTVVSVLWGDPAAALGVRPAPDGMVACHRRIRGGMEREGGGDARGLPPALRIPHDEGRARHPPLERPRVGRRREGARRGGTMNLLQEWREGRQRRGIARRRRALREYYALAPLWLPPRATFRQFRVALERTGG